MPPHPNPVLAEPRAVRWTLVGIAVLFLSLFLLVPLVLVFGRAFSDGIAGFVAAVADPYALASIRLTLVTTAIVVPINLVFGVAAAWAVARFRFRGRSLLVTMLDVPFSVSPVIVGLTFVLLFGAGGWFAPLLQRLDLRIVFALPGIVLATLFITTPFVARELIPLMESQGVAEEEAALTLGAGPWTTFRCITLPKIRWGLLYGTVLCAARSVGEFGAVSVVSGHIRGRTTTVPLHVEMLYNEYRFTAAFAVASLLAVTAVVTLAAKHVLEVRAGR